MKPPRRNSPSVKTSQPELALLGEHAQDLAVFDLAQARIAGRARVEQLFRPQEAADVIGSVR